MGRLPDPYSRFQEFTPVAVTLRDGFWMGRYEVTQGNGFMSWA